MKKAIFVFCFVCFCLFSKAGIIILEFKYSGKNIYVQNPFAGNGVGSCTEKVLVNGKETNDSIIAPAFEINLGIYGFKKGDSVNVKIYHKDDCKPKILNTGGTPKNPFQIVSAKIVSDSFFIKACQDTEQLENKFILEQFRWNKWVKWDSLTFSGKNDTVEFVFNIKKYIHTGKNQFRIKWVDYTGQPRYSKGVYLETKEEKDFFVDKGHHGYYDTNPIPFKRETYYELYDKFGKLVLKGYGKSFYINQFPVDVYYLNYDNKTTEIIR